MAYIQQDGQATVTGDTYEVHIAQSGSAKTSIVGMEMDSDQMEHNADGSRHIQQDASNGQTNEQGVVIKSSDSSIEEQDTSKSVVPMTPKQPNSYKYPLLKRYFEFGPWVGRNRKALCHGCQVQTSSSQPDRLLRHLNRCVGLSDEEKQEVVVLMNERTANKRKKPNHLTQANKSSRVDDDETDYSGYEDSNVNMSGDLSLQTHATPIQTSSVKKFGRHSDKHSAIDDALTRFIMAHRIPLKTIHSREFVALLRTLNPEYHIPSKEVITSVLIPRMLNII